MGGRGLIKSIKSYDHYILWHVLDLKEERYSDSDLTFHKEADSSSVTISNVESSGSSNLESSGASNLETSGALESSGDVSGPYIKTFTLEENNHTSNALYVFTQS